MEKAVYSELFNYKGCNMSKELMKLDFLESVEDFEVRDSDIFVVTYPKSGTIWTLNILCLILYEGHRNGTENIPVSRRCPSLEYNIYNVDISQLPSPRVLMSHLPYYLLPQKLRAKKGKVIYVYRNPKDILVSYFHYHNSFQGIENATNLEEYMQDFLSGNVASSLVFDHMKGWYTHQNEFNILILCYEEIMQDLRGTVLQICKFVGKELSSQEVDKVVEMSTLKNMKADPRANYVKIYEECFGLPNVKHIRKGTVGDWKNIMTVSQSERFDEILEAHMKDISLKFIWDIKEIQSTQNGKLQEPLQEEAEKKSALAYRPEDRSWLGLVARDLLVDAELAAGFLHLLQAPFTCFLAVDTPHLFGGAADLRSSVLKICNFLGKELSEKEVDDVVDKATFDNMKVDSSIVGDWKNTMTVAQSEKFDHVFKERMGNLPFEFCWDIQEDPKPISTSVEGSNM
ncbi:amine sulfotransferase-like [Vipera latastei]